MELAVFDDTTKKSINDLIIEHSGIKGMHWYQRRFQNEDGSLTEAGRKRYNAGEKKLSSEQKKKYMSDRKQLYKHKNEFTKAELKKAIERFKAEDELYEILNKSKIIDKQERVARKERARERRSEERIKKLENQNKLEIERLKGENQMQLERDKRKAQDLKAKAEAKKNDNITAKLGKTSALLKNIAAVSENGYKLAADLGFVPAYESKKSLFSGLFSKTNWSEEDKTAFKKGMSGQEYKDWKKKQEAKAEKNKTESGETAADTNRKVYKIDRKLKAEEKKEAKKEEKQRVKTMEDKAKEYMDTAKELQREGEKLKAAKRLVAQIEEARWNGKDVSGADIDAARKAVYDQASVVNQLNSKANSQLMQMQVPKTSSEAIKQKTHQMRDAFMQKVPVVGEQYAMEQYLKRQQEELSKLYQEEQLNKAKAAANKNDKTMRKLTAKYS